MMKKILTILFFTFIISISVVSATDFNETNLDEVENSNTVYVNSSYTGEVQNGSYEAPYKNLDDGFKDASTYSKENIFIANGNYTSQNNTISKNLNIIGENSTETFITSYLSINNGCTVNIFNLTFQNSINGVINVDSAYVNIYNSIFKNNSLYNVSSANLGGAAIYNNRGHVNISNSSFIENHIYDSSYALGISIFNKLGFLNILNSKFSNNSAKSRNIAGLAIYSTGSIDVRNSLFENNTGEAIYSIGGLISIFNSLNSTISNCSFISNQLTPYSINYTTNYTSYSLGLAISFKGVYLNVSDCIISDNSYSNCYHWNDSLIYVAYGTPILTNNTFKNTSSNETRLVTNKLLKLYDSMVIESHLNYNESIPSKYDLREFDYVTPVKNQQSSSSCWTFASLASLESYLKKFENITYDFSENNLKNVMSNTGSLGFDYDPNNGGNYFYALAYLLRWSGPINESDDPFNPYSTVSLENYTTVKHVQGISFIPARSNFTDNEQLKIAILKYGGVFTSYYNNGAYYNSDTYSYYFNIPYYVNNHAICIVGWDDNYSASNFKITPPGDGAFIVKNSWGSSWADGGYFYISYYDNSLFFLKGVGSSIGAFVFTDVENSTNYDSIYQYDPLGNTFEEIGYNNPVAWMKNVFNASSDGFLASIGFYTFGDSSYDVYIYVNNDLKLVQFGNTSAGYNTIKLNNNVLINKGDIFEVVVKLNTPSSNFPIAIESNNTFVSSKATSHPNESFVSYDGVNWTDLYEYQSLLGIGSTSFSNFNNKDANVCLKAYVASKLDSNLNINVSNINYKEDLLIKVSTNESINDTVLVTINNQNYSINLVNGLASLNISNLQAGNYDVIVNFTGNLIYKSKIAMKNINVYKIDSSFNVTVTNVNSKIKFIITSFKDLSGNLTIYLNGLNETIAINNGTAIYLSPNLEPDNYTYYIVYSGDNNYKNNSMSGNYTLSYIELKVSNVEMFYKGGKRLIVTLTSQNKPLVGEEVTILINNVTYLKNTNESGQASIALNLISGNYIANVTYNSSYGEYKESSTVKIKSTVISEDITKMYKNGTQYYAKFLDSSGNLLNNSNVRFNINGIFYDRKTDDWGIARLNINLIPDEYVLTAYNPINGDSTSYLVTVKSIIESNDLVKYYRNGSQFSVKLLDDYGNAVSSGVKVTFNINGVFYERFTNSDGIAILSINLQPNDYVITVIYNDLMLSNNVKVLDVLQAQDIQMSYKDGTKFECKLLDGLGKSLEGEFVSFNINGVFYSKKTDNNGIARLAINLNPGEYIITSSYNESTISNKIRIS